MQRWEHLQLKLKVGEPGTPIGELIVEMEDPALNKPFEDHLKQLGHSGWELVSVTPMFAGFPPNIDIIWYIAWLKRPAN